MPFARLLCLFSLAVATVMPMRALSAPPNAVLAIHATPIYGHNAVDITVTGPSQVPVEVTLTATIDPDVPTVTISRKQLIIGADGKATERISLAPDYWEGSHVTITATSIEGVPSSATVVTVLRANPHVPDEIH